MVLARVTVCAAVLFGFGFGPLGAWAQMGVQGWESHAGNPQHTANSPVAAQQALRIRWSTPVDLNPQYSGNDLLIHYGTPLVTRNATVIVTVKTGATDGFKVEGRRVYDGQLLWTQATDYSLPPYDWTPPCGCTLVSRTKLAVPGAGGTVYVRRDADDPNSVVDQFCFYGLAEYGAHKATYDDRVKITSPLTADAQGNVYFTYEVSGPTPANLVSGIAKIGPDGTGTWVSAAQAANDSGISYALLNCAPALSNDGSIVYVGVGGDRYYLLGLSTTDLSTVYKVQPLDPHTGNPALVSSDSTATPMVGPDGDVYFGMFDNPFGYTHLRGYMLHFDQTLQAKGYPGAFGWDDTASVVPASCVPSYHGSSTYLILTKYNNYLEGGGDGSNKVAVLDPNDFQVDPIDGTPTMKEVLTVLGPTTDQRGGVKEWCINSAAIDPVRKCAIVNSEDGSCYTWDFTSNVLQDTQVLTSGIGEAYTPTIISPEGTVFAINNASLYALGDNTCLPTTMSMVRGRATSGSLSSVYYDDADRLELAPGPVITSNDSPIQLYMSGNGFADVGQNGSFSCRLKSLASSVNIRQTLQLWDFTNLSWVTVDQRTISSSESDVQVPVSNPARFLSPITHAVLSLVSYKPVGPVTIQNWRVKVNVASWTLNP